MTDTQANVMTAPESVHTTEAARKRLQKRYAKERNFRLMGLSAILVACSFLVILLWSIVGQAVPAFTFNYLNLPLNVAAQLEGVSGEGAVEAKLAEVNFDTLIRDQLYERFPEATSRNDKRALRGLVSSGAGYVLGKWAVEHPDQATTSETLPVMLSDFSDLYLKGKLTGEEETFVPARAEIIALDGGNYRLIVEGNALQNIITLIKQSFLDEAEGLRDNAVQRAGLVNDFTRRLEAAQTALAEAKSSNAATVAELEAVVAQLASDVERYTTDRDTFASQAKALEDKVNRPGGVLQLDSSMPSFLVNMNQGMFKILEVQVDQAVMEPIIAPKALTTAEAGSWSKIKIEVPEANRKLSDKEIVWIKALQAEGAIETKFNSHFLSSGASREAELAGIWGAIVGSFWTMLVTLLVSFPVGVAAAIYLEEFAPKNRFTDIIEVNINNLAAVPSIVFGLLGLAVFLNFFGFPRSAPVAGGMVLALMTLPTIIIASRAALRAVPPSIREAALGVGASKMQTVFQHVLPLAMPGILTGTIIGMAQALGETAPLLMIGMVAFIVDIPSGPLASATVLPVQIFMWADFPEPGFQQKTAAAIIILLGFLVIMNLLAVILRRRFERRW